MSNGLCDKRGTHFEVISFIIVNSSAGLGHSHRPEDGGRAALRRVRVEAPAHPRPQAARI